MKRIGTLLSIGILILGLCAGLCAPVLAQETPPGAPPAPPRTGAEQGTAPGGPGMMGKGMMDRNMMQMCMPMMNRMTGQMLAVSEMMQILKETLQIERRIIQGVSAAERKSLAADIERNLDRLNRMMNQFRGAMMGGPPTGAPMAPGIVEPVTPPKNPHAH